MTSVPKKSQSFSTNMDLKLAVSSGNLKLLSHLLKNGADINQDGGYCLIKSVEKKDYETTQFLLEHGIVFDRCEYEVLNKACNTHKDYKLTELLLDKGFNMHVQGHKMFKEAFMMNDLNHFKYVISKMDEPQYLCPYLTWKNIYAFYNQMGENEVLLFAMEHSNTYFINKIKNEFQYEFKRRETYQHDLSQFMGWSIKQVDPFLSLLDKAIIMKENNKKEGLKTTISDLKKIL